MPLEARTAVMARDIHRPSAADIALHRITHLPYRPWCADCVAGKGCEEPHRRTTDKESRLFPTVLADYMFMARKKITEDVAASTDVQVIPGEDQFASCEK